MYFKATYSNGYCGCDITNYFKANNEDDVAYYMDEGIFEYAESYAHVRFGWDKCYTDEDWEEYCDNCSYGIEEITDMNELEDNDIIDLTE